MWSIVSNMKEKRTRKNDDDIAIVLYNHCLCLSVSRRLKILCIMFKTIAFFIIMLFSHPYMWVDNLLTCGKHLHYSIISLRRKVWYKIKTILTRHLSLKCLYQARTASGHIFVLGVLIWPFSTIYLLGIENVPPTFWYFWFFILLSFCIGWLLDVMRVEFQLDKFTNKHQNKMSLYPYSCLIQRCNHFFSHYSLIYINML